MNQDKIQFSQRDPGKIGNGTHDYDVLYENRVIGQIYLGSRPVPTFSTPSPIFVLFGSLNYNLPVTWKDISSMGSNDEIFEAIRPGIYEIYASNTKKED